MTDSAIEVGLIGYGLAGRAFHAPVIRAVPGMRLTAILQRTGNEAAEKYPDVRVVRSLEELLAIREILLVVIATPNDTHYSFACSALKRVAMSWWTSPSPRPCKKHDRW